MEQDIILQEKMIRYLQNDLPEGERMAFKEEIDQSAELQTALQELQTILTGFKAIQAEQIDQQLETWENQIDHPLEQAEFIAQVQAYFDGTMLESERLEFEKRIDDLPDDLANTFRELEQIHKGFQGLQLENLETDMQSWEAEIQDKKATLPTEERTNVPPPPPKGRVIALWQKVAIAAAVVGSILALVILLLPGGSSMDRLMANAKVDYEIPAIRSANDPNPLTEGFLLFQDKNYAQAAQFFEGIPADEPIYEDALRWSGYAHFEADAYQAAAASFQELADIESLRYGEEAAYMYALSLLPFNEAQGLASMRVIARDTDHEFQVQAQEVIDRLSD
ncbi:MAG: hypothetical protein AAF598_09270 [Bacteroidota bacterium]